MDQEYELSSSGTIDLTCDDAEVRITGSERTTAHVVVKRVITKGKVKRNRKFDLEVIKRDGDLVIREKQFNGVPVSYGSYEEDYTITIEAPENVSLRVQSDDGDLTVQQGEFSAVDVASDDGDIALTTSLADAGRYELQASDGKIDLRTHHAGRRSV